VPDRRAAQARDVKSPKSIVTLHSRYDQRIPLRIGPGAGPQVFPDCAFISSLMSSTITIYCLKHEPAGENVETGRLMGPEKGRRAANHALEGRIVSLVFAAKKTSMDAVCRKLCAIRCVEG